MMFYITIPICICKVWIIRINCFAYFNFTPTMSAILTICLRNSSFYHLYIFIAFYLRHHTEETEAEDKDTTAKKKENLKTVGEKKDGCIAFKLRNATSKKIIGLAIKTADETEFTENMMEEDDSFELKEKKRIYFSKETEENAEENTDETAEDKAPTYDMRITFEDGTSADVHGIVLEDLRTLTIREKDGIVYGTYKLKSTKEKKTTYDTEKAIL